MEGRSSKLLRELMFDEFFKCRTEYRTLKYEHVKKYIFKRVKNKIVNGTGCITHNL